MASFVCGTYIGPEEELAGETASLLETRDRSVVKAQFHHMGLRLNGIDVSYGWHEFPRSCFNISDKDDD